jgi:L-rhamnose mutarotase
MKVWIFQTNWYYDGGADITKVFDSKEKAEKWKKRMEELSKLHDQYHSDGTVKGSTYDCPEIQALIKEAGSEDYLGEIVEMTVE